MIPHLSVMNAFVLVKKKRVKDGDPRKKGSMIELFFFFLFCRLLESRCS